MPSVRAHFEDRAAALSDRSTVAVSEQDGAVTVRLQPNAAAAAGVVLYLVGEKYGTVALDDPACVPAELGDDPVADQSAIDYFIDVAVEGRATAFHLGRGECVEVRDGDGKSPRSWHNAWPWPGWRTRAERVAHLPYA
jgi:hypothetical protein